MWQGRSQLLDFEGTKLKKNKIGGVKSKKIKEKKLWKKLLLFYLFFIFWKSLGLEGAIDPKALPSYAYVMWPPSNEGHKKKTWFMLIFYGSYVLIANLLFFTKVDFAALLLWSLLNRL
jgi:hypothetical protein